MEDFIYSQKFDNYLKGKMDPTKKDLLEKGMQQDPLLENELSLQKDIFNTLGEERKQILKNRLDQVAIHPTGWLNIASFQWAAILGSLVLLSSGTYLYIDANRQNEQEYTVSIDVNQALNNELSEEKLSIPTAPISKNTQPSSTVEKVEISELDKSTSAKKGKFDLSKDEGIQQEYKAQFVRPNVVSSFNDEPLDFDYNDFEEPNKKLLQKSESISADVVVEINSMSEHSFHYKMVDHKLFLFGKFEGIPYRIIAVNTNHGKTLYLKYSNNYYSLDQSKSEVTPLVKIKESDLIKSLQKLSN